MLGRWTSALIVLLTSTNLSAQAPAPQDNVDIGALVGDGKKPCDADKKKAEAAAAEEKKKADAAVQGLLGQAPADKKPEPTQKSLGALPGMGHCK